MEGTESNLGEIRSGDIIAGRYRIMRHLGGGGMGHVYLAHDTQLGGEAIAVKVLHSELNTKGAHRERFLREVQLTRKVTDQHVIRTFDVGNDGDKLFLTMEYVQGVSLREWLEGNRSHTEIARLIEQICDGLSAIHKVGIIHRDLKPSNILVTPEGEIKIADFGIARPKNSELTHHNEILGSAQYMAPEVWRGRDVQIGTDLYALGVIWYELVTGILPFDGEGPAEIMSKHLNANVVHPAEIVDGVPRWVDSLIVQLLSKEIERRPKDAAKLKELIIQARAQSLEVDGFKFDIHKASLDSSILCDDEGEMEALVLPKRALSDAPAPLDPESAKNAAISFKNRKTPIISRFGRSEAEFSLARLATSLVVIAASLIFSALLGYLSYRFLGSAVSAQLSSLQRNAPMLKIVAISLQLLLLHAILFSLPVLSIAFTPLKPKQFLRVAAMGITTSFILLAIHLASTVVQINLAGAVRSSDKSILLASTEIASRAAIDVLTLDTDPTLYGWTLGDRVSIYPEKSPSITSYARYSVLYLLGLAAFAFFSLVDELRLKRAGTRDVLLLFSFGIVISLLTLCFHQLILHLPVVDAQIAWVKSGEVALNLGGVSHTISYLGIITATFGWTALLAVASRIKMIRNRDAL